MGGVNNKCSLHLQYHDWGETLEQGTDPPTAPRAPQYGCPLLRVCVHCCECALGWVKCRGQIPRMGHHTWPHTTSLSPFPFPKCINVKCNVNLQVKTVQNSSKQICGWILMWETTGDGLFHWRKCYYGLCISILARSNGLKFENALMNLFFTNMQLLFSQDINWRTGVVWITCGLLWWFYQCLDSHSDGTHSLQSIHWWASDGMLHFSKSDEETNSSTSRMAWWGEHIFSKRSFLAKLLL